MVLMDIRSGFVMVYYCFDVGSEIDFDKLGTILGELAEKSPLVCRRLAPPYLQFRTPPFFVREGEREIKIGQAVRTATIDVKIYGFGVITVRLTIPFQGPLEELVQESSLLTGDRVLRETAISQLEKTLVQIGPAVVRARPNPAEEWEDYYIYLVGQFSAETDAAGIVGQYGDLIARILRSEEEMSKAEKEDALKYQLSYYGNDLTLIDWNSSFIYDPDQSYDVPDVIEFAVIQLLELRLYDSVLDTAIEKAYDDLSGKLPTGFKIPSLSSALRKLSEIKLDISETIDRLENYLKLIGDLYLAKVYAAASARFYLDRWKSAVRDKLNVIESLYTKAWERTQTSRMVIAEIAIVVLFIIDVILILLGLVK